MIHIDSIATASAGMVPYIFGGIVACVIWRHACRWLCREGDIAHQQTIIPNTYSALTAAARGAPSDRLFLGSLSCVAIAAFVYAAGYLLEVTPASSAERAFITDVIRAGEQIPTARNQAKALEAVVQGDPYVSRRHFTLAVRVFERF